MIPKQPCPPLRELSLSALEVSMEALVNRIASILEVVAAVQRRVTSTDLETRFALFLMTQRTKQSNQSISVAELLGHRAQKA